MFQKAIKKIPQLFRSDEVRATLPLLAGGLLGIAIVWYFGFNAHDAIAEVGRVRPDLHLDHATSWEFGALLWNLAFDGIVYVTFPYPQHGARWLAKVVPVLLLGVVGILSWFALKTLSDPGPEHIAYVFAIGVVFTVVDWMLFTYLDDDRHRFIFKDTFFLADLPMLGAFGILLAFQWLHLHCFGRESCSELHAFMSGAISFQLVAQNVTFATIQVRALNRVKRRAGSSGVLLASAAQPPMDKAS